MTRDEDEAHATFRRLMMTTDRFLDVMLEYAGSVPFAREVVSAARRRMPVMTAQPHGTVANSFKKLAGNADMWPRPQGATGRSEFFWERLIQADVLGRHARV